MVPPLLEIEMGVEEEFPLAKVTVPPESTGLALAPKLPSDTDEPAPTVVDGLDATVMLIVNCEDVAAA